MSTGQRARVSRVGEHQDVGQVKEYKPTKVSARPMLRDG